MPLTLPLERFARSDTAYFAGARRVLKWRFEITMSFRSVFSFGLSLAFAALWMTPGAFAQVHVLRSPDRKIEVRVRGGARIEYDVLFNGAPLLQNSTVSINIDQTTLGRDVKVKSAKERTVDQMLDTVVHQKSARVREHYNEIRLETDGPLDDPWRFRAGSRTAVA